MVKFKSGILFLVLSLFPLFLLLIFLSCFLVGYLTLFNILSSCSYAIFEDTFVYILCFLRSRICIISLYMRLIVDMSFLYKCDSSLCLAQILIFTNLYHLVIPLSIRCGFYLTVLALCLYVYLSFISLTLMCLDERFYIIPV